LTTVFFALYPLSVSWIEYSLNVWSFAAYSIVSYFSFPFLFLYAMLLISKKQRIDKRWLLFIIPHCYWLIFIIVDLFLINNHPDDYLERIYYDRIPDLSYFIFYKFVQLYVIGVMLWFLKKLKSYQAAIKDYHSNIEGIELDWLKYFSWFYISVYAVSFVSFFFYNIGVLPSITIPVTLISTASFLTVFWMIYRGIKQYAFANFSDTEKKGDSPKKYANSSLSEQYAKDLFKQINELFLIEKIYHNPDLKVQDIAKKLGVTNHNVSQVLNEVAGKSFYDFVNHHRLNYFKEQLVDPEKRRYTILALGMESGFNSKASINRVFKQQIGITPGEYQQQMLAS
ncbi:MAG: AraC family transcriptional regulator, partial [Ekhidna sp.]|nr:AraC family transcriptional regulator [Ekhidna sp.]